MLALVHAKKIIQKIEPSNVSAGASAKKLKHLKPRVSFDEKQMSE
jgi:hypothetical protein